MKRTPQSSLKTRREFLKYGAKGASLIALSQYAPGFAIEAARSAELAADKDATIFVFVKLGGGNDGLNTLVPVNDGTYYDYRPNIAIPKDQALMIEDDYGLNPAMSGFQELYKEGNLAVFQDVGYPNSTRSHFSGQDFYERGGGYEYSGTGWLGRYLDADCPLDPKASQTDPNAVHISRHLPITLRTESPNAIYSMLSSNIRTMLARSVATDETATLLKKTVEAAVGEENPSVSYLNMSYMNALVTDEKVQEVVSNYKADVEYPEENLASDLRAVAALISSGMGSRIYSLDTGGFDTHSNENTRHEELLGGLSGAVTAFVKDLQAKKLADQVIVMPFSEFGRRPYENGTAGTDHGTQSCFFVAGTQVKGGLYASHVTIPGDRRSDLMYTKTSTDFRQLYATVLDQWLGGNSEAILGKAYEHVDFIG
ncbi:MAG: DUF1501 domain-containing protein [Verrucomicrobiales bacterium]